MLLIKQKSSQFPFTLFEKYFFGLNDGQLAALEKLAQCYEVWNAKINLISRKDMANIYLHHILHSLSVAKVFPELSGKIIDLGTGGGLPGLPLAIVLKDCFFYLVDSKQKKIKVVKKIAEELSLLNVLPVAARAENFNEKVDFVVCRGVADLKQITTWTKKNIATDKKKSGWLLLKGGNLKKELSQLTSFKHHIYHLNKLFIEDFFDKKLLLHLTQK